MRTLGAQLRRGLLRQGRWGVRAMGAVWEPGSQRQKREGAGGAGTAQGGQQGRGEARRLQGRRGAVWGPRAPAGALPSCRGAARGFSSRRRRLAGESSPAARAGSLFSRSECVAAERLPFVGKQTPGRGRCRPASHARGAHAPAGRPGPDSPRPPPPRRAPAPPPHPPLPLPAGAPLRLPQAPEAAGGTRRPALPRATPPGLSRRRRARQESCRNRDTIRE